MCDGEDNAGTAFTTLFQTIPLRRVHCLLRLPRYYSDTLVTQPPIHSAIHIRGGVETSTTMLVWKFDMILQAEQAMVGRESWKRYVKINPYILRRIIYNGGYQVKRKLHLAGLATHGRRSGLAHSHKSVLLSPIASSILHCRLDFLESDILLELFFASDKLFIGSLIKFEDRRF